MIRTRRAAAPAARFGLGLLLLLPCVLLQPASGFVAAPSRLAPPRPASSLRSTTTTMSASPLLDAAAIPTITTSPFQQASSTVVADYFSTVDEIARGIGDRPWLQYFIPTAVGMSIALAIVFSLYIAAQPYEPPEK